MADAENEKSLLSEEKPKELIPDFSADDDKVLFIDDKKAESVKGAGDDVMLMQCILCVVLAVSAVITGFADNEFQSRLVSLYRDMMNSPAEHFLAEILKSIEAWFGR